MRMSALLRERCRLHQSVVDTPIDFGKRVNDSVWIIVGNHRHGFPFTLQRSETETATMLHRLIYGRLIHRAHRFHRKGRPRGRLVDWFHRLLRSHPHRFFSARAHRFCQKLFRLFRNRRRCLCRDHLDYIVCDLVAATVAAQSGRRQALATCAGAERHRN